MIESPRTYLAVPGLRHVFLRDMTLPASIGVHPHEHDAPQRVRINVDLTVAEAPPGANAAGMSRPGVGHDDLGRVVDYELVAKTVRAIVCQGHVQLVETLAERIAESCLMDDRVQAARIRVEKLDVFEDTRSVGVEIARSRATCPPRGIDS